MTEQELDRILAEFEPRMQRAVREALRAGNVDRGALLAGLRAGNREAILAALNVSAAVGEAVAVREVLAAAMLAGATTDSARRLVTISAPGQPASGISISFDAVNDAAVAWADEHAATKLVRVTDETREAIGELVGQGLRGELTRRETEAGIRAVLSADETADLLEMTRGLTRRDAQAVRQLHAGLVAEGRPITAARQAADRALTRRAEMIARTEVVTAANQGTVENARLLQERLGVPVYLEWLVVEDDRLCELCAPLAGRKVQVGERFPADEAAAEFTVENRAGAIPEVASYRKLTDSEESNRAFWVERTGGQSPALHPGCRCTVAQVVGG